MQQRGPKTPAALTRLFSAVYQSVALVPVLGVHPSVALVPVLGMHLSVALVPVLGCAHVF